MKVFKQDSKLRILPETAVPLMRVGVEVDVVFASWLMQGSQGLISIGRFQLS
jgi:hypothetical protein